MLESGFFLYFAWQPVAGYGPDWCPSFSSGSLNDLKLNVLFATENIKCLMVKRHSVFKILFLNFSSCSYFQVIYKYPRNHLQSQKPDQSILFYLHHLQDVLQPLHEVYLECLQQRWTLKLSLHVHVYILPEEENIYIHIIPNKQQKYISYQKNSRENEQQQSWHSPLSIVELSIHLRSNFLKVNTKTRQKWTQIFKFSLDLCEPYIWLKYHENSH